MVSLAAAVHRRMVLLAPRPASVNAPKTNTAATATGVSGMEAPVAARRYCASPIASAAVIPGSVTTSDIHP